MSRTTTNYSGSVQTADSVCCQHGAIITAGTATNYTVTTSPKSLWCQTAGSLEITDFGPNGDGVGGVTVIYTVPAGEFKFNGIATIGASTDINVIPRW